MDNEQELISALRQKDPQAYEKILEAIGDSLFRVALRILRDEEKAHEAVQEALLKMLQNIDRFEGRSSLKTWLYRITVNEALMSKRKELPRLDDSIEELLPHYEAKILERPLPDWTQNPEKLIADHQFHEDFAEAVSALPEPLRTSYVLKDIESLSEQEICDILGITKAAVKNRAHRARLLLRQKLGAKYGD
jgi:RNA polymerase sigma-70 factor (ECF subfamily)